MSKAPSSTPSSTPANHVLEGEWAPGGVELTPTMKLRRRPIERAYEAEIEGLYGE